MPAPRPIVDRFWDHTEKTPTCWLWKCKRDNARERRRIAAVRALHGDTAADALTCGECAS